MSNTENENSEVSEVLQKVKRIFQQGNPYKKGFLAGAVSAMDVANLQGDLEKKPSKSEKREGEDN